MDVPILCQNCAVIKLTSVTLNVQGNDNNEKDLATLFKCIECRDNTEQRDQRQIDNCNKRPNGYTEAISNNAATIETLVDIVRNVILQPNGFSKKTEALPTKTNAKGIRRELVLDEDAVNGDRNRFGETIRKEFELDEDSTFLNNGSYGAVPKRVHGYRRR